MNFEDNIELQNLIDKWISAKNYKLVKKIAKLSNPKYMYNLCKLHYRNTQDVFYLDSMIKINLFYSLKAYIFLLEEKRRLNRFECKKKAIVNDVKNIIQNIVGDSKFVYIIQYSFFDKKGENYFSGGGERYACDLAALISKRGYKIILLQAADFKLPVPWCKKFGDIHVVGVNAEGKEYCKIVNSLQSPELAIYSGAIPWEKSPYKHSVLISHGITWDCPRANADINYLQSLLYVAKDIVSVDTNTLSWFRSTFSKTIKDNNIQMNYIPNYVDLKKYTPKTNLSENRPIKILFPRRCSEERGFWPFTDIIPELFLKFQNIEIDMVGYAHTPEIKERIDYLSEKFPLRFKYYVCSADEMPKVYQNADISVIPTIYSEGTSLSCIEAMSSGNAVIATVIGGLPNLIINNFNGMLINPDKNSLMNALTKVILDKEYRAKIQSNAVNIAQEFSKENWERSWNLILDKYLYNEQSKKKGELVILTRNAVLGGVESIIKHQSQIFGADVIVCGGLDCPYNTPFDYMRADDKSTLASKLKGYSKVIYHWLPKYALETLSESDVKTIEFVHREDANNINEFNADAYVTHSEFLADYVAEKTHKKCIVVSHPIDTEIFYPAKQNLNYIGGLTTYSSIKGLDVFINAWAQIKDKFPHIKARFYGKGEELDILKILSQKLNAEVEFLPPTTKPEIALRDFRCIVSPSRIEGLPVAILEALAMNIPVIASNLDGMVEFQKQAKLKGYPNVLRLTQKDNIEDLANAIVEILEQKSIINTREYIKKYYNPKTHCDVLKGVLEAIDKKELIYECK